MLFHARRTTAQLYFAKPLDCCCNCGRDTDVALVETALQQTRFYFVFGTELRLHEDFPYCDACRRSATRVRPGGPGKLLMAALTTAVLFFLIVMASEALPRAVQASPFRSSLVLGVVGAYAYFGIRARRGPGPSYYQPVRLVDAQLGDGRLQCVRLEFANADYCRLFARANADYVAAGVLQVEAAA